MAVAHEARPLRIAIDARLPHGKAGGVESVILGLASALSRLEGPEEYVFLTIEGEDGWIRPALNGPCRAMATASHAQAALPGLRAKVKQIPGAAAAVRTIRRLSGRAGPPRSDGTVERHGIDVVHLAQQWGFRTRVPSIYHPHDLQHRHLPQYFTAEQRSTRDLWYSSLCRQAAVVAVASSWTKQDVIEQLAIPENKVHVVPWAPPLDSIAEPTAKEMAGTRQRLVLPSRFVLYPAQTWAHKNHIGLLQALARLRTEHDVVVPAVFTGLRTEFAEEIDAYVRALSLEDQIIWAGFLAPADLRAVMAQATAVVVPTKFEAASAPVWESFSAGVPVACSNVTSLPAQAGDAALLFDPEDTLAIADAVGKLWAQQTLRETLVERGRRQVARFTWQRAARHFRALYRKLGSRQLSDEDEEMLRSDPLL